MPPMANTTVEKMEVDDVKKDTKDEKKETPKDINAISLENLKEQCTLLDKGESHVLGRIMQVLHKTRKQLNNQVLHKLVQQTASSSQLYKDMLLSWIPAPAPSTLPTQITPMETDAKATRSPRPPRRPLNCSAETDLYIHLLFLVYLLDNKEVDKALEAAESLIQRFDQLDKRTLEPIVARAYFYLALIYERKGRLDELRSYLNARLRTATVRRYTESQAVLIYTLLRAYLIGRHYPSAAKLVSKVTFPEGASNNDLARFLYYQGRIKAMQLDYSAAAGYFLQAMRKSPQDAAIGFKQNVQKWIVVVGLLQGDIPERSVFRTPFYRRCLQPYLELTQAVRLGDLVNFNAVLAKFGQTVFEKDETLTLIVRLRQNVIKTAIKQISAAYSRVSIKEIAQKLQLQSETETEYMVAKAIADGAIDALIACEGKGERFMQSNDTVDVYRTTEPQFHYDNRIKYCLQLHNQAVKALRFPPKDKPDVETIEQQREREQQELEFAKELADEEDDDF